MAAGGESNSETLRRLAQLSQEHEILIAKRQALLQMQKHEEVEIHSRTHDKKKEQQHTRERNKKLLDDIEKSEQLLKDASYSISENKLETLKENYYELLKRECPSWLHDVEMAVEKLEGEEF
eukprot:Seg397.34 transcript_id=Seg397.34/GoldUCD/mRNA.D3Y31 product="hypothetical protein" protein_id=Seg397.34/GoldUCD/D3Y31